MNKLAVIVAVLVVVATVILVWAFIAVAFPYAREAVGAINDPNEDYEWFLSINALCNCTQENASYCESVSGCIHAYEYCQREQCPECWGGT